MPRLPDKYHLVMYEFELRHPRVLAAERWFWRQWRMIRYPRLYTRDWWKWHKRPAIGDQVEDCRGEVHRVTAFGKTQDDLILDDGTSVSWMSCCDEVRHGPST